MKKTKKDFEAYINAVIKKYKAKLLLHRHIIKAKFDKATSFMAYGFSYPYLNSFVLYSDKAFEQWVSGENMKPYIIHELCHAITDPLYAKAISRYITNRDIEDERENLTDAICNIVLSYDS